MIRKYLVYFYYNNKITKHLLINPYDKEVSDFVSLVGEHNIISIIYIGEVY